MKCFVTGGAGFIGSFLVDGLIERGDTVTVYDNLSTGKKEFIAKHLSNPKFKFIQADLLELDKVKSAMNGHDFVFHLAANPDVRKGISETDIDLKHGIIATYNVLESMRATGVKKIAFTSSSVVYGDALGKVTDEDFGPLLPISLYGAGKLGCEGLISSFSHTFDLQAWIYRLANIIGARSTHGVIFDFMNKLKNNPKELEILGDGGQSKSYLRVEEFIDAVLFSVQNAKEPVNVFNIGCDSFTNVKTIADIIVRGMGLKNVGYRFTGGERGWKGDIPICKMSVERINRLGWMARLTSDQAVEKTVAEMLTR